MNKETGLKVRSGHLSIVSLVLAAALLAFMLCGQQLTAYAEELAENPAADSERIGIIGAMDIEVNTLKEAAEICAKSVLYMVEMM